MRRNLSALIALAAVIGVPAMVSAAPESSNFKPDNRQPNLWNVKSAIDGDLESAWQLPGDSPNKGEWVKIDVPQGTVDKIGIYPGWGKSDETYADYARIKKIDVEVFCCTGDDKMNSLYTGSFDVADKPEMQIIDIEDTHRDLVLATNVVQGGGYVPDGYNPPARHVDFLTSYPPGDLHDGQLWGPMREETNAWFQRIYTGQRTPHATAADGHRNLMLTMAMDLSAKRGVPVDLPVTPEELMNELT